jgi:hypothetical protein
LNPSLSTTGSISINLNQDQTRAHASSLNPILNQTGAHIFSQAHFSPMFSSPASIPTILIDISSTIPSNTSITPSKKFPPKINPHNKHQPHPPHKQKPNKTHILVLVSPATHKPPQNFSLIKKRTRVFTDQKPHKKGSRAPRHNSLLNDDMDTSFQTTTPQPILILVSTIPPYTSSRPLGKASKPWPQAPTLNHSRLQGTLTCPPKPHENPILEL